PSTARLASLAAAWSEFLRARQVVEHPLVAPVTVDGVAVRLRSEPHVEADPRRELVERVLALGKPHDHRRAYWMEECGGWVVRGERGGALGDWQARPGSAQLARGELDARGLLGTALTPGQGIHAEALETRVLTLGSAPCTLGL